MMARGSRGGRGGDEDSGRRHAKANDGHKDAPAFIGSTPAIGPRTADQHAKHRRRLQVASRGEAGDTLPELKMFAQVCGHPADQRPTDHAEQRPVT